ncbi:MAG TPA: hypothetical protein VI585_03620 [Candidatus Binatia bacterium]
MCAQEVGWEPRVAVALPLEVLEQPEAWQEAPPLGVPEQPEVEPAAPPRVKVALEVELLALLPLLAKRFAHSEVTRYSRHKKRQRTM